MDRSSPHTSKAYSLAWFDDDGDLQFLDFTSLQEVKKFLVSRQIIDFQLVEFQSNTIRFFDNTNITKG